MAKRITLLMTEKPCSKCAKPQPPRSNWLALGYSPVCPECWQRVFVVRDKHVANTRRSREEEEGRQ